MKRIISQLRFYVSYILLKIFASNSKIFASFQQPSLRVSAGPPGPVLWVGVPRCGLEASLPLFYSCKNFLNYYDLRAAFFKIYSSCKYNYFAKISNFSCGPSAYVTKKILFELIRIKFLSL